MKPVRLAQVSPEPRLSYASIDLDCQLFSSSPHSSVDIHVPLMHELPVQASNLQASCTEVVSSWCVPQWEERCSGRMD